MVITVTVIEMTGDIDAATVERFVDGLRVADQDALDELLDTYGTPAGDLTPPLDAEVIAAGEIGGRPWDLFLEQIDTGHLDLAFVHGIAESPSSAGSTISLTPDEQANLWDGSGRYVAIAPLAGDQEEKTVAVFGLADVDADEVTLDHPDGTTHILELHQAPGRLTNPDGIAATGHPPPPPDLPEVQVFIGFVPVAEETAQVTAVDADGDPLPGWPVELDQGEAASAGNPVPVVP